jgi:hypothetical protein
VRGAGRWTRAAVIAGALAMALGVSTAGSSESVVGHGHVALHVIPFPGTPDASATSQIIFESLPVRELRSLTVLGSSSGRHAGALEQLPDSAGAGFTPAKPFDAGELVRVKARLQSRQDGALLGDPGASALSFSFRVQVTRVVPVAASRAADGASGGATQSFRSAPSLHPPAVKVSTDPDTRSGDLLLTPVDGSHSGPMILNAQGKLVWFQPVHNLGSANLQVQRYQGHPVLTWWQGIGVWGADEIVNRSYHTVATVRGAEGYLPDQHEFQITPRGTALIDAWSPVQANLTSVGGAKKGTTWDCLIQELDIRTGQLLWEWHALGHIPLSASYTGKPKGSGPYDFCHLNSIQLLPGGDLLISARATWAVYKIDRATGRVIWSLGGKHSDFRMAHGTRFEWQHDARLHGDVLTLFDDADSPQEERQSSAKVLQINAATKTVSLLRRYTHSPPLLASVAGSAQILPNHDVFVGWGAAPDFSEYTPTGRQIFNGAFALGVKSYRALRSAWSGQPRTRPALALSTTDTGKLWAYASWNGATRVAGWSLLGGPTPRRLRTVGRFSATGFETAMAVPGQPRYLKVQALGAGGRVLGSSWPRPSS